jgi:hemerythrin-like metal-binding protein
MAFIEWNDSYSVGVKVLDDQHQSLFKMVNELHAAMMRQERKSVTVTLLGNLLKCSQEHFDTEERMMEAAQYPGLAQHRAYHHELTKKAQDFMARIQHGESGLTVHLLSFFGEWINTHIHQEDKAYGPYINKSGVH